MNTYKVIELNNSAVSCLSQQRPKKALRLLSLALADLKDQCMQEQVPPSGEILPSRRRQLQQEIISDSPIESQCNHPSSYLTQIEESLLDMDIEDASHHAVVFSSPVVAVSSNDSSLILNFNHALILTPEARDHDLLSAVVVYNMAFINHSRAMERGISSLMTDALQLYEIATSVIISKPDIEESCHFVLLALYNNMAQIHSAFFRSAEMCECIEASRIILMSASPLSFPNEADLYFFSLNAMLQVEGISLAPAA